MWGENFQAYLNASIMSMSNELLIIFGVRVSMEVFSEGALRLLLDSKDFGC